MPHARNRVPREEYDMLLELIAGYNLLYANACSHVNNMRKEIDNERKMRHDFYYAHGENCKESVIDMQAKIIRLQRRVNKLKARGDVDNGGNARK